jgi:hypothetical protein
MAIREAQGVLRAVPHTCKHRLKVGCDEGGNGEGGAVLVLGFSLWFLGVSWFYSDYC